MAIRFPSLADTQCKSLTVCGELLTDDTATLQWLRHQKTMQARYGRAGETGYVRIVFAGGRARGRHFHVDVAQREYFGKSPPALTHKIADVRKAFEHLSEEKIRVGIEGVYYVAREQLPDPLHAIFAAGGEMHSGEVSVRLTGATFAMSGAPIREIKLWTREQQDEIGLVLSNIETSLVINDTYLEDCLQIVDALFSAFLALSE